MHNIDKINLLQQITKLAEQFQIKIKLREEEKKLWDELIYNLDYAPVHYSNQELDYQTLFHNGNGKKINDFSTIFYYENQPISVWPLSLKIEHDEKITICSQGVTLWSPLLVKNLNSKIEKKLIKCSLEILIYLANNFKINEVKSISTYTGNTQTDLWFYENFKRGVEIFPELELLVNLSIDIKDIQKRWSKSTNNDIKKASKIWKYKIHNEIDVKTWDQFKNLHFELAGKKTRSDETWYSQTKDINNKKGFAVYLFDKNNKFVGGSFFRYTNNEAIYSSGVYRRELFNEPLSHYAQYIAIKYMQSLNLKWYKIGHISNLAKFIENDKEKNIASFKKKFSTDKFLRFNYIHKFK